MTYAGIGSRQTPPYALEMMHELGGSLAMMGYTLRSGGAEGADTAFYEGAIEQGASLEIYLPWRGFGSHWPGSGFIVPSEEQMEEAEKLAAVYHPFWRSLSQGGRKLIARNSFQVLGLDLETPSDFIVCWTRDGGASGGTGQALRIALDHGIPVYNLFKARDYDALRELITPTGTR